MDKNPIIAVAIAVGLSSHFGEIPADLSKVHAVTEHHVNITDSFSASGDIDHTDANDRAIDIDVLI